MNAPAETTFATCPSCDLPMDGTACTKTTYEVAGRVYDRIPFASFDWAPEIDTCNDCGIKVGALHHPRCDLEECPVCHQQAIMCGCVEMLRIAG
jgi:hypothetical protein